MRIQVLEDQIADYKKELNLSSKRNDALQNQIENMKTPKKRKKTTSMDIEDDEDALTDNDMNIAAHSRNLFEDSSVSVLSPKNVTADESMFDRKSKKTPTEPTSKKPWDIFSKTPKKVSPSEKPWDIFSKTPSKRSPGDQPWDIFSKTPKKVSPKSTNFKTPLKNQSSDSKPKRVLALYSPRSKKILVSPLKKDLPKRVAMNSGWTSKKAKSSTNLINSMSFINNCNKENKALIQSRLVFPKSDGNSLILESEEETFCDEIQSSQKSPGPRHNKSKRLK